jgi:hypothetical protein
VVNEIAPLRGGNAQPGDYYEDEKKLEMVNAEENITLFLNFRAFEVEKEGTAIKTVLAKHIETAEELSFSAPLFADCTGDGSIGYWAGADYSMGRESRAEYNEPSLPRKPTSLPWVHLSSGTRTKERRSTLFPLFDYGIEVNEAKRSKCNQGRMDLGNGG